MFADGAWTRNEEWMSTTAQSGGTDALTQQTVTPAACHNLLKTPSRFSAGHGYST